uniref:EF-hand domain-containing protein n=1 Tax=Mantoniella antarctica TaxID=81844 RepID=A0A7S0SPZ6_9CHLO|mmetsp:Transcript_33151/g.83602  ORF Transcript_33151/g.83602 Transcript_33151/m.83602 type:complete len:398 (-) Transcript_33151:200-1393(-)|eukprot:CAMPEP_0181365390 /NCGR_PEP_ID=MMETSP1106-20121128/10031_1 /TAXON_ID=81844 /ORGANISM="Mantoniella antarctica, Strain SL-175" /LENGTH=397 /DNA_ID=CAMNT_0023480441 /DNA_START=98 /DNA_END=1291 /DNA_ORIENTATION=-
MVSCARVGGGRSPTRSLLVLALFAAVACCSARKIFPGAGSTPRPNSGSIAAAVKGAGFAAAVEEAKTPEHDAAARDEDGDGKHHREDHSYHLDDSPYGHDYDGFNDFNVTQRLQEIFPLMDVDHDGHISKAELKQWHLEQGKNSSLRRAASEFETSDNDKDGYISLKEYLEEDFEARLDAEDGTDFDHMGDYNKKWIRNTRITFNLSDANHDGKLNADEFYMFLHPEESGAAAKLVQHLVQQDVNDHDRDHDGKLNFTEFYEGMYSELEEQEVNPFGGEVDESEKEAGVKEGPEDDDPDGSKEESKKEARAHEMFEQLDTDKDGKVTPDEVRANKAALKRLHPTEDDTASDQTDHLVEEADGNKDGKLTLSEIMLNSMAFYNTAMNENDQYQEHDEF